MLSNLLFDLIEGRLGSDVLKPLLQAVAAGWNGEDGHRPDFLLVRLADELLPSCFCKGTGALVCPPAVSRIIDDKSFLKHNLSPSALSLRGVEELPPHLIALLERGIPTGAAIGDMSTARPFAWVTVTEALEELRRTHPPDALAAVVRDKLGLSHYARDEVLLEIVYPEHVVAGHQFFPPTFIDGGVGLVYRSQHGTDGWGTTIDLATLGVGLPEAVHPAIPFSGDFLVRALGRLSGNPPHVDWEAVLNMSRHPWTPRHRDLVLAFE